MVEKATKKHIYRKGSQITSFEQLVIWIKAENWIYLRDKPLHFSMILNMSFGTVQRLLPYHIWEAIKNEKESETNGKRN